MLQNSQLGSESCSYSGYMGVQLKLRSFHPHARSVVQKVPVSHPNYVAEGVGGEKYIAGIFCSGTACLPSLHFMPAALLCSRS